MQQEPITMLLFFLFHAWANAQIFPNQTYYTEPFVAPGWEVTQTAKTAPGFLFFGVNGNGYVPQSPIIMNNQGDLVWYGAPARHDGISNFNFGVQKYQNQKVLVYWTGEHDDVRGHSYGSINILDANYTRIKSVCLRANIVAPAPGNIKKRCFFDVHESFITDHGTVLGIAINVTQADLTPFGGNKNGWVYDGLFYEVDIATERILFSWSALDHIPLTKSNFLSRNNSRGPLYIGGRQVGQDSVLPWDWFHINSVSTIPGGYLVSSRMTWSIYKINGKTGAVEWTLEGSQGGDFSLDPGLFWSWQHDSRLVSSSGPITEISLFNNDDINIIPGYTKNQSTGLLLQINMTNKHVKALRKLKDDSDKVYATAEGSYQALPNGHVLLGFGARSIIKEFDSTGAVILNAQFGPLTTVHGGQVQSYRAYRYQWSGQPKYPPKAVGIVQQQDNSTMVYMSWNGATTYNSWNIYAGAHDNLTLVASNVTRTGFETGSNIGKRSGSPFDYVQVEALHNGTSIMNSSIIQVQNSTT